MTPLHARAVPLLGALTIVAAVSACGTPVTPAQGSATAADRLATPSSSASAPSSSATASAPNATTTVAPPTTGSTATSHPSSSASTASLPAVPLAGAEPTVRFPGNEPAVGSGANPVVSTVPDALWSRMVGYSWTPGCPVGRSQLRLVSVNFWGFDGHRSRGEVVVSSTIAAATAQAFDRLYGQQFRIRQMRPMDSTWGRNPKGPGADDYAAMSADNTSAFNCRYVGGQEASRVYSKHAYGTAVDVNDFENPYVADDGTVYPQRYFVVRRGPAPGVFSSSSSAAVRAFTAQGLRWGGLWSKPDYQHFER